MDASQLTLNIAVNLGRIARFAMEGKRGRVEQFMDETQSYLDLLEDAPKKEKFVKTFRSFDKSFNRLKKNIILDEVWAEEILTWANILTHRAKLA